MKLTQLRQPILALLKAAYAALCKGYKNETKFSADSELKM